MDEETVSRPHGWPQTTAIASFRSSPWTLGAPHRGLAFAMLRISAGMSSETLGRPVRRRLFQVQKSLKPRRCHTTTVSGWTRTIAGRQSLHIRESQTQSRRSVGVKRTRGRRERSSTFNWWLRARISRCSAARERTNERTARTTDAKTGITDRRLVDAAANLNEFAVRSFW